MAKQAKKAGARVGPSAVALGTGKSTEHEAPTLGTMMPPGEQRQKLQWKPSGVLSEVSPFTDAELRQITDALGKELPGDVAEQLSHRIDLFVDRVINEARGERCETSKLLKAVAKNPLAAFAKNWPPSTKPWPPSTDIMQAVLEMTAVTAAQGYRGSEGMTRGLIAARQLAKGKRGRGAPPDVGRAMLLVAVVEAASASGDNLELPQHDPDCGADTTKPLLRFAYEVIAIASDRGAALATTSQVLTAEQAETAVTDFRKYADTELETLIRALDGPRQHVRKAKSQLI